MGSTISGPDPLGPLLDYHQLETFVIIGVDDYLELLGEVIEDVPVQLALIHVAIKEGNAAQLQARAHAMRGLVAYFGCIAMTARLAQLEQQPAVPPEQADAIHAELRDIWDRSLAALKAWETTLPDFAP